MPLQAASRLTEPLYEITLSPGFKLQLVSSNLILFEHGAYFFIKLEIFSELDLDKFVSYDSYKHPLFDGWLDTIIKDKEYGLDLNKDEQGHPSIHGMKLISIRVLNKIKKLYLNRDMYNKEKILNILKLPII